MTIEMQHNFSLITVGPKPDHEIFSN